MIISTGLGSGLYAAEPVAITEFMNDPDGSSATDEWVELFNYGTTTETLTGWRLKDEGSDNALIPTVSMGPGEFLVLARNKAAFEALWLNGVANAKVVQFSGTFAMSDTGDDELVLFNGSGVKVWSIGYGPAAANGVATYYALDDLATTNTNHGGSSSATWINRNGNDLATGRLGYEGSDITEDPMAYLAAGGSDYGSPLSGHYQGAKSAAPGPVEYALDLGQAGTPINPGVRGLAIADQALNRGDNSDQTGILPCLERVTGSSIRGVAGGLNADVYDWKKRNNQPRPTTLEFMRYARNTSSTLVVTANIRGLIEPDPNEPGKNRYYTSDTVTLANLAADWVRYTNHIAQTYRQGDTISDSRDAAILSELTWSTGYVNPFGTADNFSTLLAPGEAAAAPVKWWEIGNEPTISLANAYQVTNGFTFIGNAAEYAARYQALTTAMLAEDPTILVGPCVVNGRSGNNANMLIAVLQSSARVDFISYHPYGSMGDFAGKPIRQQSYLAGVYEEQKTALDIIKALVATYRPGAVSTMRYIASETNVSDWPSNNNFQEGCMAHALGSVESVMSFARLGLDIAHYWIWITATPTYLADTNRFVVSMAWEKMRDELDDRLIGVFDANDQVRIYVTRGATSSTVKLWAMNFSHTADTTITLNLANGPAPENRTISRTMLRAIGGGPTNLFSANLNPEINGGVARRDVDWTATEVLPGATDLAHWPVFLPAATLSLFKIETTPVADVGSWQRY